MTNDNPLHLAEITGWLSCHRETMQVEYASYLATLRRYIKGNTIVQDRKTIDNLRKYLMDCRYVSRSSAEYHLLKNYIDRLEPLTRQTSRILKASSNRELDKEYTA